MGIVPSKTKLQLSRVWHDFPAYLIDSQNVLLLRVINSIIVLQSLSTYE